MPLDELISGMLRGLSDRADGYRESMPYFQDKAALYIDAYEARIRTATDLHMTVAKVVALEPVHSFAATWANLTRDIVATQVSSARWILDV